MVIRSLFGMVSGIINLLGLVFLQDFMLSQIFNREMLVICGIPITLIGIFSHVDPCVTMKYKGGLLKKLIQLPAPNQNRGPDPPVWNLNTNGTFDIASAKKAMISIYSGNVPIAQASTFKTLCKSDIPKKCKFFI